VSPSPPNTTITLFVDHDLKGRADGDCSLVALPGCWVALVKTADGVRRHVFAEASDRTTAVAMLRERLNIPRRPLNWKPTSPAETAWTVSIRV
jgi:hypothetical protein